jgi:16S rRNA (guanine527-N7)-methyltransferase
MEAEPDVPHGTLTEAEARAALDVPHETLEALDAFVSLLAVENARQNLVSRASLEQVWNRHILDSAQLVALAPATARSWIDLGSGAGFPGLVAAALHPARFTLAESRRLRVDFLRRAAVTLGLEGRIDIPCARVETLPDRKYDVISARAFAPLETLLDLAERFSTSGTVWILPKGRNAKSELDAARASWQGDFRLEPSRTDADARIIVAREVRRVKRGKSAR